MNEPRLIQIELTGDELTLLEAHLKRHLDQVDKELVRIDKDLAITGRKLDNPSFVERAKPEVVQAEREKLGQLEAERGSVHERLEKLRRAVGDEA